MRRACLAVCLALAGCDLERSGDAPAEATPAEPMRLEGPADGGGDSSPDGAPNAHARELFFGDLHVGFSFV